MSALNSESLSVDVDIVEYLQEHVDGVLCDRSAWPKPDQANLFGHNDNLDPGSATSLRSRLPPGIPEMIVRAIRSWPNLI